MKHVFINSSNFKLLHFLLIFVLCSCAYIGRISLLYLWYLCGNIRGLFLVICVAIVLIYSWYCCGCICVMFVVILCLFCSVVFWWLYVLHLCRYNRVVLLSYLSYSVDVFLFLLYLQFFRL